MSIADRRHHLGLWAARFGHLRTLTLPQQTAALNDQLRQWRETLSASACNHRRDALTNLVKVLYGRRAAAELVDLVRFTPPPPKPRWIDRGHIADVLAQLTPGSKTAVRLRLMHWTGMRPSQMGRLQPEDFRLDELTPFVAVPRGKGGRLAAIPLVGDGLEAARAFMALRAYGPWSCASANKALRGAAQRAGRPAFTVYQIPAYVRDGAATHRIGRGGHSGSVRAYGSRNHDDLRPTAVAETCRGHRATPAGGRGANRGLIPKDAPLMIRRRSRRIFAWREETSMTNEPEPWLRDPPGGRRAAADACDACVAVGA